MFTETTFNWIATYKQNEDENNQPPGHLPEGTNVQTYLCCATLSFSK